MADRYNRLDNTSPLQSKLENDKLQIPRSVFDLSHIHSGQALIGALTPVLCREVIPNQELDINLNALIELRNPTTRKLLNGCRVYFHALYNRCADLWEGWNNYIDTGRSGSIKLNKPNLVYSAKDGAMSANAATPLSLMNYMGIPAQKFQRNIENSKSESIAFPPLRLFAPSLDYDDWSNSNHPLTISAAPDFIDALPFMAYQRNWRDFYSNKNLLQNNKKWFPDNEDHFILSYDCTDAVCVNYENENFGTSALASSARLHNILGGDDDSEILSELWTKFTFEANNPMTFGDDLDAYKCPNLAGLKFRQFKGDRFTTALPFPDLVRGSVPNIADIANGGEGNIVFLGDSGFPSPIQAFYDIGSVNTDDVYPSAFSDSRFLTLKSSSSSPDLTGDISIMSSITMNDIRALEVFTVFKERMARTSGDYNDMIEAQFGYNPHQHNREATYIGGCYQDIVFSSISQTSASTADSPLGTKAGQGVSSSNGRIGHFTCPDYGWVQIYMSIVPDVYYTQGLPKQFSRRVQEDNYFPVFNNLAPQAILNKELFISGDTSVDNDVFAFEERFQEMKSVPNRVSGLSALSHNLAEYDASSVMSRRFSSTPAFNSRMLTLVPENVDMDVFSFNDEPPFDFSIGFQISSVAPIPYTSVPGKMDLHA